MRIVCLLGFVLAVLFSSCGGEPPCSHYDSDTLPEEREMADRLADAFVEAGFPEPCCPVNFCREHEPCQEYLDLKGACGAGSVGFCKVTYVDVGHDRLPWCDDPARTIMHEWLHNLGYRHGAKMNTAQQQILNVYQKGGLPCSDF